MKCSPCRSFKGQWVLPPVLLICYLNVIMYCLIVIFIYYLQCVNRWKCLPCRVLSDKQMYWRCKRALLFFQYRAFFLSFTSCKRRIYCLTVWMSMLSQFCSPVRQGSYCSNMFAQRTSIVATGCKDPTKHISHSFNLSSMNK